MQERRATVRIPQRIRAQYCSSEDLRPRDGHLTDLSARGAGLVVREAHRNGEMLSVGFSLPGSRSPLTATGVVRWSDAPRGGRWYPVGLDWLQVEETARHRLHRFLADAAQRRQAPAALRRRRIGILLAVIAAAAGLVAGAAVWVAALLRENQTLQAAVELRSQLIRRLEQEEARLAGELEAAQAHLAETAGEVARLDQQTQGLGDQVERLSAEVGAMQGSYQQVREERDALTRQVLALEQERALLAARLSSVEALRLAIEEAAAARQQARTARQRSLRSARLAAEQERLAEGNRGYVIKDGRPTLGPSTLRVRVHEPASAP